jgi:RimJ/RimL family protein N-acetyltransferase
MSVTDGTTPTLQTGHLVLRPWRLDASDRDFVLRAASDPDIARYSTVGSAQDPASADHWLTQRHERDRNDWVLERGADSVGRVSLASIDRRLGSAEFGYWVLPEHRRRGYALLGVIEVMRFAEEELGLHDLRIEHEKENRASCALALRLGFTRCAPAHTPVVVAGTPRYLWVHHARRDNT